MDGKTEDKDCILLLEYLIESMAQSSDKDVTAACGVLMVVLASLYAGRTPALLDLVCEFSKTELARIEAERGKA